MPNSDDIDPVFPEEVGKEDEQGGTPQSPGSDDGIESFPWDGQAQDAAEPAEPAETEAAPAEGGGVDSEDPAKDGPGLTWQDIAVALKESKGDRRIAAKVLGITQDNLSRRISNSSHLKRLWGPDENGYVRGGDVLRRRVKTKPFGSDISPEELAEALRREDREVALRGYAQLGISDETVKKLRTLDGLAKTSGKFLSTTVETAYRTYSIQQLHLFEESERIRETYLRPDAKLPPDERMYYYRLYHDMVKECGRGYMMLFDGAASIVQMLSAARAQSLQTPAPGQLKRPGKEKFGFSEVVATPGE